MARPGIRSLPATTPVRWRWLLGERPGHGQAFHRSDRRSPGRRGGARHLYSHRHGAGRAWKRAKETSVQRWTPWRPARTFLPSYAPLAALRQVIEERRQAQPGVKTAQQGAAAALFTLGAALNREGAEETVAVYLQFARALNPGRRRDAGNPGQPERAVGQNAKTRLCSTNLCRKNSPMRRVSELQLGLALADLDRNARPRIISRR
jgi:hypothetical protein